MNFDPFEFYGNNGNDDFFNYGYGNGYGNDYGNTVGGVLQSFYWLIGLMIAAIVLGVIINYTFLKRKNEGRFHGFWEKVYNCFSLNRFYTEGIVKLLNVITFLVLTFLGIYMICTGGVVSGILVIVFGNLAARLSYELIMMFVIFCKKTVSMDKKLSAISKFYDDMEDWDFNEPSDDSMTEEDSRMEAMAEMPDSVNDVSAFEPETVVAASVVTEEVKADETAVAAEEAVESAPESYDAETFEEKLRATLGDPDAPKYGYDEECKTCDSWNEEEQDCYCPDDCLTCEKPDEDKKAVEEVKE